MKKKLLSVVLALAMVLSLMPMAWAEETAESTGNWIDNADTSWYEGDGPYIIDSAEELAGLAKLVNEGTTFKGKTIELGANIDLGGKEWTPIGIGNPDITLGKPFSGTFNGSGKTIFNLSIHTPNKSYVGLFGYTTDGEVKNFTLHNAKVTGDLEVGAIAGTPYTSKYTDISVTGLIQVNGRSYVGGALGKSAYKDVVNVDVLGDAGSYVCAVSGIYRAYVGGLIGYMGENEHTVAGCDVKIDVTGSTCDVGGILGILHYGNTMKNCTYEGSLTLTDPDKDDGAQFGALTGTVMNAGSSATIEGCTAKVNKAVSGKQDVTSSITPHGDFYYRSDANNTGNVSISAIVNGVPVTVTNDVAQVEGTGYKTVAAAVNAAKDGETVTLLRDVTLEAGTQESGKHKTALVIPAVKQITLDLNGFDLTCSEGGSKDTNYSLLSVEGNLTIQDSKAVSAPAVSDDYNTVTYKSGRIQGGYWRTVEVQPGGHLTVKSGHIKSSAGDGIYAYGNTNPAGSSNVENVATSITIEDGWIDSREYGIGVSGRGAELNISGGVITAGNNAAVAGNGTNNVSSYEGGTVINITDGTMISHIDSETAIGCGIYHPQAGTLNISGGTIYADHGVGITMRGGTLDMTGGTVISTGNVSGTVGDSTVKLNCYGIQIDGDSKYYDYGNCKVNISGNTFVKSDNGVPCVIVTPEDGQKKMTITGGLFSSDPSDYCVESMTGVTNTDSATNADYPYAVGEKVEGTTPAVVESATVPANTPDNASQAAKDVAEQMTGGADVKQDAVLEGAIKNAANSNKIEGNTTLADGKTVTDALNAAIGNGSSVKDEEVAIVYQPYVDVTVTDAAKSGEKVTSFTADLTPMYRVVATTNAVVENNTDIKVSGDAGVTNANAVLVKSGEELNGLADRQYEVKLALPDGFASAGEKLCIKHEKNGSVEYYTGTVSDDGKFVTFITNGFSPFTVYAASESAASIGENVYPTLQAAVDAVENNGIIKLLKNGETATVNRTVKFTVAPGDKKYTISLGGNCTDKDTAEHVFDVVYTAPSGGSSSSSYTVNVEDSKNGTVTASHKSASKNTTVTLTVKADKGYELDELTVTDKNGKELKLTDKGNGKYTFAMPASKVDVKATFAEIVEKPAYSDVSAIAWYAKAVAYVTDKGMMEGDSGKFMPQDKLTRSQMAQVLFNLEGKKSVNYALTFGDMNGTEWYAEAVRWAASEQIVNGYNNGNFGPNDPITREQLVTVLYRYAQYKGLDTATTEENLTSFADAAQVSGYAVSAMNWAVGAGVINGTDSGLAPKATATRAEVAQILMNFDQKF